MANENSVTIGKVIPTFKGDWNANTSYSALDVVVHKNITYVAETDILTGAEPKEGTGEWSIMARGAVGPQGEQGIQGIQGPIGPIGPTGPVGPKGDMDLSQITVGGRNLLLGTTDWKSNNFEMRGTLTSAKFGGLTIAETGGAWTSPRYSLISFANQGYIKTGTPYVFSTYVRNTSDNTIKVAPYGNPTIMDGTGTSQTVEAHGDWKKVYTVLNFKEIPSTSNSTGNGAWIRWETGDAVVNGKLQFAGYKLEEGNVPTDWSPAPEDVDARIDNLKVGGRNYILNSSGIGASASSRPILSGGSTDASSSVLAFSPDRIVMTNNPGNTKEFFYGLTNAWTDITKTPLIAGNTYTFSVKARGTAPQIALRVGYQYQAESVGYTQLDSTKWTKATFTFTIPVAATNIFIRINGGINNHYSGFAGNETIEFKEVMLEQSNVSSDWSPAPEDADSTYVNKSNQLPAEARDFAYLAAHMQTYQGTWWTGTEEILNGPTSGWTWATVEVIPGNAETTGQIRTMRQGNGDVYSTNVNGGTLGAWIPLNQASRTAPFTDFSDVAKNMKKYQGTWMTTANILNGPVAINFGAIIHVIHSWDDAGLIVLSDHKSRTWVGLVSTKAISGWKLIADDSNVVHKTGAETVDGDKKFTGNINFSGGTNIVSATTRGQILDGYDLNGYTEPYKYVINGAKNLVNYPSGASAWATLEVENINDKTATQTLKDSNSQVFIRSRSGNTATWSAWRNVSDPGDPWQVVATAHFEAPKINSTSAGSIVYYKFGSMVLADFHRENVTFSADIDTSLNNDVTIVVDSGTIPPKDANEWMAVPIAANKVGVGVDAQARGTTLIRVRAIDGPMTTGTYVKMGTIMYHTNS